MSSPEEIFSKLIPKINKSFGDKGKGKMLLLNAFAAAGFPFDEDNFPSVEFDASIEHLNLLFPNPGYYGYSAKQEKKLFGAQTSKIIIHTQALYELIEEKLKSIKEGRQSTFILHAACAHAIDAILTEIANAHEGEYESQRDLVLLELLRSISPQSAEDFQRIRNE